MNKLVTCNTTKRRRSQNNETTVHSNTTKEAFSFEVQEQSILLCTPLLINLLFHFPFPSGPNLCLESSRCSPQVPTYVSTLSTITLGVLCHKNISAISSAMSRTFWTSTVLCRLCQSIRLVSKSSAHVKP